MMDLENTDIHLLFVDIETEKETLCRYLSTPATTVCFESHRSELFYDLLIKSGFQQFKNLTKLYFQVFGELILIINVYETNVKEKYWIKNTESNLEFVQKADLNYESSFQSYYSDASQQYNLYPEAVDVPFFEHFEIRQTGNLVLNKPSLIRVDIGFKYAPDQFIIASLFKNDKNTVHICYDDYNDNSKKTYPDFIEFEGNQLSVVQMLNRATSKKISLLEEKMFDSTQITLSNFHLFWERMTPEEKTLLDILLI